MWRSLDLKAKTRFQLTLAALSAVLIARPIESHAQAPHPLHSPATLRSNPIEESQYVRIGGIDQWIQISGTDANNPVLLWLNGGPGGSTVRDICLYRSWERAFTIVMWDQRGEGKTFQRSGESVAASMTIDQMSADGIELAQYLTRHLHTHQIIVLGHSWGSILGVHMVTQRPDLFAAYVGTGQVINLKRQLEAGYPALLARAAANEKAYGELKALGAPPWSNDDAYQTVNRWANVLDPPSKVDRHVCESERRELTPSYIQAGAQFSSRLLSEAIGGEDLQRWAAHFDVPVYFIQGRDDVLTTTSVVAAYVGKIEAPSKALIELPGTGHLAIFRDPDAFLAALEDRVGGGHKEARERDRLDKCELEGALREHETNGVDRDGDGRRHARRLHVEGGSELDWGIGHDRTLGALHIR